MGSAPLIEMRQVSTAYDGVPMLRAVDIQVFPGELVCLLGSDGSGKTTTFKTLTGIVKPISGAVSIFGRDIAGLRPEEVVRLGIGVVPEERRLFPRLTTEENLLLGFRGSDRKAFMRRFDELAGIFPRVRERFHHTCGLLSGGEQAMVAFLRALMSSPSILVMDEPSLGLSPLMIEQYFAVIDRVHKAGSTIFLIEQNASLALTMADRAYILEKGRIQLAEEARKLLASDALERAYLRDSAREKRGSL